MSLLLTYIKKESGLSVTQQNRRRAALEQLINLILAGAVNEDDPMPNEDAFTVVLSLDGASEEDDDQELLGADNMSSSYSTFRLQPVKEGSAICFKISCVRQQKLMKYSDQLIRIAFGRDGDDPPPLELPSLPSKRTAAAMKKYEKAKEDAQKAYDEKVAKAATARNKQNNFVSLFNQYKQLMSTLRVYSDFSDAEIDDVQLQMDAFTRTYREMFGEQLTNYLHDMQSGHMTYFLRKYKNLYRFANIGFEALMGHVRSFYERGTQKGGYCNKKGERMSTVRAFANYLQEQVAAKLAIASGNQAKRLAEFELAGKQKKVGHPEFIKCVTFCRCHDK